MSKSHIMVVEDHPDLQEMLWRVLVGDGYTVSRASSAEEALESMQDWAADLMISDIELPGISGLALMRAMTDRHALLAISISGAPRYEDGAASKAAGFSAHLVKPFNVALLLATVSSVLHHGGGLAPLLAQPVVC